MSGVVLVLLMVVIGGITRLTQSGLSIAEWAPIMGSLPPMSSEEWNRVFDLYKETPEFKHYNFDFSLSDFKAIYFWEYLHRLLGRVMGAVFLVPFIYFWFKNHFSSKLKWQLLIVLFWGGFQGVLGWFMVKSGLVDKPHVSHYRLATHLLTAIGLMCYIFWIALSVKKKNNSNNQNARIYKVIKVFMVIVFFQIMFGAFVAGLKAGLFYNTFPKMGEFWLPIESNVMFKQHSILAFTESGGLAQFVHRVISYVLFGFGVYFLVQLKNAQPQLRLALKFLVGCLFFQISLGIATLLLSVPIILGILHQFGALTVILSAVYVLFISKPQQNYVR
ncbi:MAG: COX15/CtaA family protein [Bacteroidia bacterium]